MCNSLLSQVGQFDELQDLLERAVVEAPPVLVRDGGVIAPGYNSELDEWRALADGATDYLDRLEIREREKLGLDTLKVGFNGVHGYYIQVSRGQSHLVPIHYVRRQTLKNAERYIIPELKEYEDKVLTSKGKALAIEEGFIRRAVRFADAASRRIPAKRRGIGRTGRAGQPG